VTFWALVQLETLPQADYPQSVAACARCLSKNSHILSACWRFHGFIRGFMVGLIRGFMGGWVAGAHDGARLGEELRSFLRAWRATQSPAAKNSAGRGKGTIPFGICKCLGECRAAPFGERRAIEPTWYGARSAGDRPWTSRCLFALHRHNSKAAARIGIRIDSFLTLSE
jgi:hypothetical protein